MPTLNSFQFHQAPGQPIQPHPQGLLSSGPLIQVQIELPEALAASLRAANQAIPSPVEGLALIDTGATMTSINASILIGLGINPVGVVSVGTAGGPQQQSAYPVKFSFPGTPLPGFELARAIGCDLTGQTVLDQRPLIALIGRDILANAILVYNGPGGMFSLSF